MKIHQIVCNAAFAVIQTETFADFIEMNANIFWMYQLQLILKCISDFMYNANHFAFKTF